MRKSLIELNKLCDEVLNKYPFTMEEDIKRVHIENHNDLVIMYENGEVATFNQHMYEDIKRHDPFVKDEEVEYVDRLNQYDVLIKFKNGDSTIYDTFANGIRGIYENELTEEELRNSFKFRLRRMMQRRRITQSELADAVSTSQTMISRYSKGECLPSLVMLKKIAVVLDCSLDDLFGRRF